MYTYNPSHHSGDGLRSSGIPEKQPYVRSTPGPMTSTDRKVMEVEMKEKGRPAEPEEPEREQWGAKMDFMLSMLGYCVGLGNVWRFPYLCYKNGGGAFLIPYLIMLTFAGLPLFFMELALGQYASLGPVTIWRCLPLFKGIGFAMCIISGLVCIYYNMIIAWSLYYMFASFTSMLPWRTCDNWWNTPNCVETSAVANATNKTDNYTRISPSEEYFHERVLKYSVDLGNNSTARGIEHTGTMSWELALVLLLAWIIVFACLCKGVKSSGKVVYFTATFPYIVLIILLIRGAILPGAREGIIFYIKPDFNRLRDSQVWYDAASQIFYSLGVAFGGILAMSSYNKFNNNCHRDAVLIALANCGTSVFAGFAIFSYIGYMAHELKMPVGKVVASGSGLAFIAYPEALTLMPISPLWSILFFFMLLTLGLDSQFVMLETIVTALSDEFPTLLRQHKTWVLLAICICLYLLGLTQCTQAGIFWLEMMNWYSAGFCLIVTALIMAIGISWVYGIKRFSADIKEMIGYEPNIYFKACWMVISPALMLFIFIFSLVQYSPVVYNGIAYPDWAVTLGLLMAFFSILMIPLVGIIVVAKNKGSFTERFKKAITPDEKWGPAIMSQEQKEWKSTEGIDNPATIYDPGTMENGTDQPPLYDPRSINRYPLYDPRSLQQDPIRNGGSINDTSYSSRL
ncbi:SLC6A5 [Branchiostoma lanceolatum]|uniref:Transporter n=3 Tax=Branchiostoma lanceolatum TaxID=7740 RepID=A0A8K0A7Z8_BRALA|nr:SLC6A5 [Branchiostoma lanceolatum]